MKPHTLPDHQKLIKRLVIERGFEKETVTEVFMLLVEEIGELGKAIRKSSGIKVDNASRTHSIAAESADVFFLLIDLCNRLDVDLEKAFEAKEQKNQNRKWV